MLSVDAPHLGVLLARALTVFTDDVHAELAVLGFGDISFVHGSKVFVFLDEPGATLSELARCARVSRQAMSQMVAQLVGRGYVELTEDERDARAKRVRLTARGWAAKHAAQPLFAVQERRWADRFGAAEVSGLRRALEQVTSEFDGTSTAPTTADR